MSHGPHPGIKRRTFVGAAWAAPVIAVAVATPLTAASTLTPTITARAAGPSEYTPTGATAYALFITNTGTEAIPAGALIATIQVDDVPYEWQGFSGQVWDYASGTPADGSIDLSHNATLAPNEESDVLLVLIKNPDRTQTPSPVATILFAAPGSSAVAVPLQITF